MVLVRQERAVENNLIGRMISYLKFWIVSSKGNLFSLKTCFTEECFKMVHYAELGHRPRWGYLPNEYHPRVVTKFECAKKTVS